jgi:hypothetical protein
MVSNNFVKKPMSLIDKINMAIPPISHNQVQVSGNQSQKPVIQASQKLIQQLTNNPLGNVGTFKDAHEFRSTMDSAFSSAITDQNLKQSIESGTTIQQKCLHQMAKGQAPQLDQSDNTHFDAPLPKHLHLSYLGTTTHSVDIVVTKNDHGTFVTICNRGLRNNHDVFETYKLCNQSEQNPINSINNLLSNLNQVETSGGDIEAFYRSFGNNNKVKINQLESVELKKPPSAKNQKAGNCVRTSISAAHKWMAHQHDCMDAHKSVKQTILESTKAVIEAKITAFNKTNYPQALANRPSSTPTINQSVHSPLRPPITTSSNTVKLPQQDDSPIHQQEHLVTTPTEGMDETLALINQVIDNMLTLPRKEPDEVTVNLITSLPELIYAYCDFQTEKITYISENKETVLSILDKLLQLQKEHQQIIDNIKAALNLSS